MREEDHLEGVNPEETSSKVETQLNAIEEAVDEVANSVLRVNKELKRNQEDFRVWVSGVLDDIKKSLGNVEESMGKLLEKGAGTAKIQIESLSPGQDSITIGAPTNGQLKAYGDLLETDRFAKKLEIAQKLIKSAKSGE